MLKITSYNHRAVKMVKDQIAREHKIHHIKEAKRIRYIADEMRKSGLISEQDYSDAMLAAIAEENRKCMERHG